MSQRHETQRDPQFLEELREKIWKALEDELDIPRKDTKTTGARKPGMHPGNTETERQLELLFSHVNSQDQ